MELRASLIAVGAPDPARSCRFCISKMKSGKRRPCCFNLSACTDPDLSKNGRLLEPGDDRP
jgi:hypothetical protein